MHEWEINDVDKLTFRYIAVELLFFAIVGACAWRIDALLDYPPHLLAAILILGGLATFRMARTLSYNEIAAWLRAPFTHLENDSSGAGMSVEPNAGSVIGGLLACPICSGTWSALLLLALVLYLPKIGAALIIALGLAGASEAIHWAAERNEWQGRAAREEAGTQWLTKNKHPSVRAAWMVAEHKAAAD